MSAIAGCWTVLTKAQLSLTPARRIVQRMINVFVVLLFAAATTALWDHEAFRAAYFLVLGLFLDAIRFRRKQFAQQRLGGFDIDFRADEEAFGTRSELGEATNKWVMIRQVGDLPKHILLWPKNRMGWMIPKRAFGTPEKATAFFAIAKEKTHGQTL